MRKIISFILAATMSAGLFSFNVHAQEEKINLYVAPGAENGDGSINSPLGSFEEARNKIREIKKSGYPKDGICVYFREGVYTVLDSVELTEEDSGTEEAPIVYRAYGNENVRFIGGVEVDISQFKTVDDEYGKSAIPKSAIDKVKSVNLKELGIDNVGELSYYGHGMYYVAQIEEYKDLNQMSAPELIFNDASMTLARYPNDDFMTISSVAEEGTDVMVYLGSEEKGEIIPPTVSGGGDKLKNWLNAKDPWVFGYWRHDWSDMTMRIKDIDPEAGTFTTDIPSAYLPKQGQRFLCVQPFGGAGLPG